MVTEELILACTQNNPLAQNRLYDLYSGKMMAVCVRFAQNWEDAEDMLQESFIKIFAQIPSFDHKGSFEGWVRRIVVNTCINALKRNKKFSEHVAIEEANFVQIKENTIASSLLSRSITDCIKKLPVGYKTILNLYAIEGYSHKEIGVMLDSEESTSRSQYTRAKAMLEAVLIKKEIVERPKSGILSFS